MDFTVIVGSKKLEKFAARDHDLLGLAAGEAAIDGADYAGGSLESETVEVHGLGGNFCELGF